MDWESNSRIVATTEFYRCNLRVVLVLRELRKDYPGFSLELSLSLPKGQTLALLGPSGSGKSTVLRLIAGLEHPDSGSIHMDGRELHPLPPEKRRVGMLFQDFALFPHLSVYENIAFGLREAGWPRERLERRVQALLEQTRLTPQAHKLPHLLSGGERQRVALARAMAPNPDLLLLDEPLGALDRRLRETLVLELRALLSGDGPTAIVVTHDQQEAFLLADQVAVMREGRLAQVGPPETLYHRPVDTWVARFLGHRNLLSPEQSAQLGLPHKAHLIPPAALVAGRGPQARVLERLFMGERVGYWLEWQGLRLYCEGSEGTWQEGQELSLHLELSRAIPLEGA